MNLTAIVYFITVSKYESFSKAAEELYISQPAISRQIQNFEEELNVSLFDRTGKNVTLTEEGKDLLPIAKTICASVEEMQKRAAQLQRNQEINIKIGYPNMTVMEYLPKLLRAFSLDYPSVKINLINVMPLDNAREQLKNFYVDAIITAEGIVKDIPWISYVKMKDGGLSAVFSKDFQHRNDMISFSELTKYEVLIHSLDHDSVSYKQLINELYTNGFKKEQIHERTSTNQILVEASMNKAIGIMPEVFFDGRIQQMKVLHISDSSNDYGAVLAYRKDDAISYIYKLVDCIKNLNLTIK